MSKNFTFFHRAVDGTEAALYSAATVVAGTTTLALGLATAALAATGVGIPIAIFTGALAVGGASGTVFSASKVHHKAHHAADKLHTDHSHKDARAVLTLGL